MLSLMVQVFISGLLMAAVLSANAPVIADPDDDGATPEDGDEPTPGTLTIPETSDATGQLDVPAGLTRVEVNVNAAGTVVDQTGFGDYALQTPDGVDGLVIQGNAGIETFVLNGSGYIVTTGDGADRVEIEGAQDFILDANEGDTVIGPDAADRVGDTGETLEIIQLGTGATYHGGDVGLDVTATGDTATMIGGAGDDVFTTFGSASMSGGDGDDVLAAAGGAAENDTLGIDFLSEFLVVHPSLLDGGAGDDSLVGSFADTMTGGAGADAFTLYLDPDTPDTAPPRITDFDPAADRLLIWYDNIPVDGPALPPLLSELRVTETGGDTVITGRDGAVVVVLADVTGLRIGLSDSLNFGAQLFTDLAGNPVAEADMDVLVQRYADFRADNGGIGDPEPLP